MHDLQEAKTTRLPSTASALTRRSALQLAAATGGLTLLAACAPAAATPTAAPAKPAATTAPAAPGTAGSPAPAASAVAAPSPAAAAAGTPKNGGTLRMGVIGDLTSLDGHLGNPIHYDISWMAFDRLIEYDRDLKPTARLAESWEISPDFKTFKLNLRKGVTFHNGRELTSEDVKWNILRVRDPKFQLATLRTQSSWFTGIETPDKSTIILKTDTPKPAAFDMFEYFNIIEPSSMEGPDAGNKLVGTGPFSFVEWVPGDHSTFKKNPSYWQTGRPYLDGVVANVRNDPQAMMSQFETGTLDLAKQPPLNDYVRLRTDPKYKAVVHEVSGFYYLFGVNLTIAPLENKKVRQALNYAIDRKRFVDTVMRGAAVAKSLIWLPGSPAYDASKENFYPFDLDKAKGLLAEAGVSGLDIDVNILNNYPELIEFGNIYQADLAKIGVKLTVKSMELAPWIDAAVNRKFRGLYLSNSGFSQLEPSSALSNGRATDPQGNNSAFDNQRYKDLIAQSQSEPDLAKRKALYAQVNDILLDESFIMPLAGTPPRLLVKSNLQGIGYLSHDAFDYSTAWFA